MVFATLADPVLPSGKMGELGKNKNPSRQDNIIETTYCAFYFRFCMEISMERVGKDYFTGLEKYQIPKKLR